MLFRPYSQTHGQSGRDESTWGTSVRHNRPPLAGRRRAWLSGAASNIVHGEHRRMIAYVDVAANHQAGDAAPLRDTGTRRTELLIRE